MLKNENIICISSIDWDFIWQGHQEIMATFAKNGNRVLFIENTGVRTPKLNDIKRLKKRILDWRRSVKGFRQEMENLYVYSPIILPFPYSKLARWVNRFLLITPIRRWMKTMNFKNPIIWTFLPTGTALDIIEATDKKLLVYYCIADFYKLADNPKKVKKTEDELISESDFIFVQGKMLEERCRRRNSNVYIFPFGVKMEAFENFINFPKSAPEDIKRIKRPIIGYIGGIHRHIDFKLIKFLAQKNPGYSIVLIGPVQADIYEIAGLSNIYLLGKKDFLSLPAYIKEFDVGIIPYEINEYTISVLPTKLNEYHAMGKFVVSTRLPEIIKFNAENDNLVFVSSTYQEFSDNISKAIRLNNDKSIKLLIDSAKKNSWTVRIEEMSNILEEALEKGFKNPVGWQAIFLNSYKLLRKKTVNLIAMALSLYLLVFYTPFMWLIASPLRISQQPQKADAIVVFAGGVGELGKPGQGYEERVQYAVDLFKNGYANNIIFSSGYTYAFKEPLIMKALAVSLGVKENSIILEENSANTYQNVKFTTGIIKAKTWHKILLVSSPYHMRRASLIFDKVAKEITVVYTPISNSLFYAHPDKDFRGRKIWKQINFEQIKGIFHEYLGIAYYWWKGWI